MRALLSWKKKYINAEYRKSFLRPAALRAPVEFVAGFEGAKT